MMGRVRSIAALFLCVLYVSAQEFSGRYETRHSFRSPFFTGFISNWDLGGSTLISEDHVRLTPAIKSRTGSFWNTEPVRSHNWEVILEFRIGGGGKLGADGMALWYSPDYKKEGPVFGMKDQWTGLGIMFDTFDNDNMRDNPQIVAVLNDGTKTWTEDGKSIQYGGCHAQIRNPYKNVKTKITNRDGNVEITVDTVGNGVWEPCVPATRLDLPAGYHFGLTAATGGLFDNHDVYSFDMRNFDDPSAGAQFPPVYPPRVQDPEPPEQVPEPIEAVDTEYNNNNNNNNNNNAAEDENQKIRDIGERLNRFASPPAPSNPSPPAPSPVNANPYPPANYAPSPSNDRELQDIRNSLNELTSRISELQSSFRSLEGRDDGKSQISGIADQQTVIADALKSLLASASAASTARDVEAVKLKVDTAAAMATEARDGLNNLKSSMSNDRDKLRKSIDEDLNSMRSDIKNMKNMIEETTKNTKTIHSYLISNKDEFREVVEKNASVGFWTYFLFIQAIFIFGFIYWKKHKDDNNKKLL